MAFQELTKQEQSTVLQAMNTILNGLYIDDEEFRTRLGIDRLRLREVLAAWPQLEDAEDAGDTCLAINNCMNEVSHGVHISSEDWVAWFTVPKEVVKATYQRWALLKGWNYNGIH